MRQADRDGTENPATGPIDDGSMFIAAYAVVGTAAAAVVAALVLVL